MILRGSRRGAPGSLILIAGASGLTTLGAIAPFLVGAQAVWVREELQIGFGTLGAAISVFFGAAAVVSVCAGLVFDRLGRRVRLLLAGSLVTVGSVAVAFGVSGPSSLIAAMVVLGAANACCQMSANLSLARVLTPGHRGLGFGIKQSAVPLAIMLGGLAVPTGSAFGWRTTFVVTAGFGLVVASAALFPRRPETMGTAPTAHSEPDRPPWGPLLLAGVGMVFASAAANFLGAFIASWGYETGLSPTAAGLLMAVGSAGSIVVRVHAGYRADRRAGRNMPVVALQMYAGAVCLLGLAIASPSTVVVFGFFAFAIGWAWPGLLLFAVARVGRESPARASAVIQAGAFVGGAVGPLGFGYLVGQVGFQLTWLAGAVSFLVAGTLVLLARRGFSADLRRRPPRHPLQTGGRKLGS